MKLGNKILDFLFKRQKLIEFLIIFLFLTMVSFKIGSNSVRLLLSDFPILSMIIAIVIAIITSLWLRIERLKSERKIMQIKESFSNQQMQANLKISELTFRQKEVFDLIRLGKTNKEILSELNIEHSTLKSHINQIYKILGINNRKEIQRLNYK